MLFKVSGVWIYSCWSMVIFITIFKERITNLALECKISLQTFLLWLWCLYAWFNTENPKDLERAIEQCAFIRKVFCLNFSNVLWTVIWSRCSLLKSMARWNIVISIISLYYKSYILGTEQVLCWPQEGTVSFAATKIPG